MEKVSRKRIEVVAAIIQDGERIFATQRGYGEFKDGWEFPGGKIEEGETPEQALIREIREELDTEIEVGELIDTVEYDYPNFHLTMHCFLCTVRSGNLVLKEHEAARWLTKDNLDSVDWLPADTGVIEKLKKRYKMADDMGDDDSSEKGTSMIQYRDLQEHEICQELFKDFIRHQNVTKCWRREHDEWIIKDDPFVDDWTEADYRTLVSCLRNTVSTGGFVHAVFYNGKLKGFVSVEQGLFGGEQKYLDLSSIHVSEDMRNQGIGAVLFCAAKEWAKENGADKLYISAHSAVESQAFYKKMGCVEAEVYHQRHATEAPYDCQLECRLNQI